MACSAVFASDVSIQDFVFSSKDKNHIKIIEHGISAFELRLQMIESAQETIDAEYFIYDADFSGEVFTNALAKKAAEGVKVRILIDKSFPIFRMDEFYVHFFKKAGIEVRYYNTAPVIRLKKHQYRNHRKMLVVDGKKVIIGGRNIADEYFDLDPKFNFIDREIYIESPIVKKIQGTFDAYWEHKMTKTPGKIKAPTKRRMTSFNHYKNFDRRVKRFAQRYKKGQALFEGLDSEEISKLQSARSLGTSTLGLEHSGSCNRLTFASDAPGRKKQTRTVHKIIGREIERAQKSISIETPYFIIQNSDEHFLEGVLEKGVEISLLTNSLRSTDAIYVAAVFYPKMKSWLEKGMDISIFKGDSLKSSYLSDSIKKSHWGVHSKSIIFDNNTFMISSYNIDPRSRNLNNELAVFCHDTPDLALQIQKDIESRKELSVQTSKTDVPSPFEGISLSKSLAYIFLLIPSNLFKFIL